MIAIEDEVGLRLASRIELRHLEVADVRWRFDSNATRLSSACQKSVIA